MLRNLALDVQKTSDGDLAVLLSSGFDAQKERQPAGVLLAPDGVTLTQGPLSGELIFRSKAVVNGSAYEGQMTMDINKGEWTDVGTFTAPRFTLEDPELGKTYWARSRAIGAAGPGSSSDAVSAMAI